MIHEEELNRLDDIGKSKHPLIRNSDSLYFLDSIVDKNSYYVIRRYMSSYSRALNPKLRSKTAKDDYTLLYEYLLNKALKRLPIYGNEVVYRMDSPGIDFETIKQWFEKRIGYILSFPNFLSTSKKRWEHGWVVFKITTFSHSGARDISIILNSMGEDEVLFMSKSKFKIIDVNDKEKYIELYEVSRDSSNVILMTDDIYMKSEIGSELDDDDYEPSLVDQGII